MKNPKGKGNAYEIQICRKLSKWVIGKDKPLLFWKIGSSGAQATLSKDVKSKLVGDVVCIDEKGMFLMDKVVIELKNVRTTNILDFISPEKKSEGIVIWWGKVSRQAKDAERIPWLIFHRNNSRLDYLICPSEFLGKLEQYTGLFRKGITIQGKHRVVIIELDYFLGKVQPQDFAQVVN